MATFSQAIKEDKVEVVKSMIEQNISIVNKLDNDIKMYPLHYASLLGRLEIVEILLANGADVNKRAYLTGEIALHYAIKCHSIPIIELLLIKGADPNLRNSAGSTILHDVELATKPEIREPLIAHGADPTIKNKFGLTPDDIYKCHYTSRIQNVRVNKCERKILSSISFSDIFDLKPNESNDESDPEMPDLEPNPEIVDVD